MDVRECQACFVLDVQSCRKVSLLLEKAIVCPWHELRWILFCHECGRYCCKDCEGIYECNSYCGQGVCEGCVTSRARVCSNYQFCGLCKGCWESGSCNKCNARFCVACDKTIRECDLCSNKYRTKPDCLVGIKEGGACGRECCASCGEIAL